jgi:hypothetical protein
MYSTYTWGPSGDVYFDTTNVLSGKRSLKIMGTGAMKQEFIPVEESAPYSVEWISKASSAGYTHGIYVQFYEADKSTTVGSELAYSDMTLTSWHTFREFGTIPSGARYARVRVRAAHVSATCYFDSVNFKYEKSECNVDLGGDFTIATATDKLEFDHETFDYGDDFDSSGYKYVAPASGSYAITTTVEISNSTYDFGGVVLHIYKNGSSVYSAARVASAGSGPYTATTRISVMLKLSADDEIEIYVVLDSFPSGTTVAESTSNVHILQM